MGKHFGLSCSIVTTSIGKALCGLILGLVVGTEAVAATYFISPTGVDSNTGTATTSPWRTFKEALATMVCGDTLNLMDGVYGDGTSTGKLSILSKSCSASNPMTFRALNQRQARINDNGTGIAVNIQDSAYITVNGLVANSTDNSGITVPTGIPFYSINSHHLILRNLLAYNVNRYSSNTHPIIFYSVSDSLLEDVEIYKFNRHAFYTGGSATNVVARRVYCNPRGGAIITNNGGFGGVGNRLGKADGCIAFYPCRACIAENVIADADVTEHYLAEFNAQGPVTGSKILGSIGYQTSANGVVIQARGNTLDYMPQNNTVKDVVIWKSRGSFGIAAFAAKNMIIDHVTVEGTGSPSTAAGGVILLPSNANIFFGDGNSSATVTNSISLNWATTGFNENLTTVTGDYLKAYNSAVANFYPALRSQWGTHSSITNPGLGTCVAWIPAGSPMKGAASDGGDIGATILYRYVNGVLTKTPLWDPTTGEFPHGATVKGVNDVAGNSLFDFHKRINVNTNGCSFPANYGDGVTDAEAPATPANLSVF
jgi:hypothetical protein